MRKTAKILIVVLAVMILFSVTYYAVSQEQLEYDIVENEQMSPAMAVSLADGMVVRQTIKMEKNDLSQFGVSVGRTGEVLPITVRILQGNQVLSEGQIAVTAQNGEMQELLTQPVPAHSGDYLTVEMQSAGATPSNAVTLYYGNMVSLTRVDVEQQIDTWNRIVLNGETMNGMLSYQAQQRSTQWFGHYYWLMVGVGVLAVAGYGAYLLQRQKKGKASLGLNLINAFTRYRFLIQQMISRDFKTKYKRSVLGVLWSFLNPLLTMSVQYLVFSVIFKSDIPNFPVYLLIGIVCYGFFTDAVGQALMSIVGNANLITKVYVPKYIYPVTRVLSSGINLLFSLVPLVLVMIISRTPFTPAALMLPFPLLCLAMFCIGMGLLLATCMTFFRDTQFLWQVLSMLWMYATPIFYPESILPVKLLGVIKLNPLYHVIRLMRSLLMDGVSPNLRTYAVCFVICFIPFVIGAWVFKRKQDRFILYI